MALRSLNQHIFRLAGGLVLLSTIAILINVWLSIIDHTRKQLTANLAVAESVFKQAVSDREEQLFLSTKVLVEDFGFKQAAATGDAATISSMLYNHKQRIYSDLMALVSLDGRVVSSTSEELQPDTPFTDERLLADAFHNGGAISVLMIDGKLYQTMLLTVSAPNPIAVAMIGFELDKELIEELKSISQIDITLYLKQDDNVRFSASTVSDMDMLNGSDFSVDGVSWDIFFKTESEEYVSHEFLLNENNGQQLWVKLSENVDRLFGEFTQMQIRVSIIALLCICLSLFMGAVVAKRLARPLRRLSGQAYRISSGDYEQTISDKSNTREISELAESFESMRVNIQARERQINYQAKHDLLTHLNNRYQMSKILDSKFETGEPFQVIGANIIGFRGINDVFGYENGDLCLKVIAERFKDMGGHCGRYNGGEYLWLPPCELSEADLVSTQVMLEQPIIVNDVTIQLKIAIGVLHCPKDCTTPEEILTCLNVALDEARATKNLFVYYDPVFEERYVRRLSIISELKKALSDRQNELNMVYQPKLNLRSGKITHAEALIRWNSKTLGFVPPDEFIGIAEQAGLIGAVTDWVIERAITDVKYFIAEGQPICVAVNLSARDILNAKLLPRIDQLLFKHDIPYECLAFEITESDLVTDPERAISELQAFRDAGFSLAIDDFGTGYSSLAYLKSLPVTDLKIDKSFVLNLKSQHSDRQIVQTIIELAHNFGLGVIAEGVEDADSLQMLRAWGCEYMQGYHVCRPVAPKDFVQWLSDNKDKDWLREIS
ncbi:bifunctional diguanylate cyclase/phosphodiesterase [Alteromonas oceanisediminis]|uniref:bifunctional diguanylate cyclase/phosphodiesterase n=1 Tax=Alteromonas oceanisediminis TaxID=2836180 RepID=UPI001BDA3758|nr:EAL domain-containing protein [Alteromonas oceanisediminis]MBT0586602.1 EAL domain-containing protein [Alteromonas oceanisediminis]